MKNNYFNPMKHLLHRKYFLRTLMISLCFILISSLAYSGNPPQANLDQVRNGKPTTDVGTVIWENGNVNENTAHMVEGYSEPYRLVMTDLVPGTAVELIMEYDTRRDGINAIDFITGYQNLELHTMWNHPAETIDPTYGYSGMETEVLIPITKPKTAAGTFFSKFTGPKSMSIWGANVPDANPFSYVNEDLLVGDKTSTSFKVKFTPFKSTVILAWGGHISSSADWGIGTSAGDINGSPYHTRTVSWTLNNIGDQDRSMQAAFVVAPLPAPSCQIQLDPSSLCQGTVQTYTYQIPDGATASWAIPQFGIGGASINTSGAFFTGVTTGSSVEVNSGTQAGYFNLIVTVQVPGYLPSVCQYTISTLDKPVPSVQTTNVSCNGSADGTATASATGGTGTYTYSWNTVPVQTGATASGLAAGTYTVTVTDANTCSNTATGIITEPDAVTLTASKTNVSCNGAADGTITASSNGTVVIKDADGKTVGTDNLAPGTYTVSASMPGGNTGDVCSATPVTLVITEPDAVTLTASKTNVSCNGAADATITASATGTGALTISVDGVAYDATKKYGPGTYVVLASASNGNGNGVCTDSKTLTITQPDLLTCDLEWPNPNALTQPDYGSSANNVLTLGVTGGTGAYTYIATVSNPDWHLNIASSGTLGTLPALFPFYASGNQPATITFTITDANGCPTTSCSVTLDPASVAKICSYTQGFYGNTGGTACDGGTALSLMKTALPSENVVFGSVSNGKTFTLYATDIYNITTGVSSMPKMLPAGGTPVALIGAATYGTPGTWKYVPISTDKKTSGKLNNILLGQAITFWFNMQNNGTYLKTLEFATYDMNVAKPTYCGSSLLGTPYHVKIPANVFDAMSDMTTPPFYPKNGQGLLALANKLLGGGSVSGVTLSDVNTALNALNVGFDGCSVLIGFNPVFSSAHIPGVVEASASPVKVYPNPFSDKVTFEFVSGKNSHAMLDITNIVGQRISILMDKDVQKGVVNRIEYKPTNVVSGILIYRLILDNDIQSGKVVYKQ